MSSPAHAITEEAPLWVRRWSARAWLWNHTTIQRVRNCGRAVQAGTGNVSLLRYPSGQMVATGLQSCKSIWACPVCSARVVERRAVQLQKVVETWHQRGGRVGFLTLTVRHTARQSLSEVWQLVMDSWRRLVGSTAWRTYQKNWGVPLPGRGGRVLPRIPTVRTVEVTHGRHGWHVHLHLLVFFDGGGDSRARWGAISGSMVALWAEKVRSFGGRVDVSKGTCAELIDPDADASARIGDYLAKAVFVGSSDHSAIHWEAAGGRAKTSERTGGSTPWELLDAASRGDQKAAKLWTVWETESRGRRQMWINGTLLDLAGLRDTTDAEALAESGDEAENWAPRAENSPL